MRSPGSLPVPHRTENTPLSRDGRPDPLMLWPPLALRLRCSRSVGSPGGGWVWLFPRMAAPSPACTTPGKDRGEQGNQGPGWRGRKGLLRASILISRRESEQGKAGLQPRPKGHRSHAASRSSPVSSGRGARRPGSLRKHPPGLQWADCLSSQEMGTCLTNTKVLGPGGSEAHPAGSRGQACLLSSSARCPQRDGFPSPSLSAP